MNDFATNLQAELDQLLEQGLFRELRSIDSPQQVHLQVGGKTLLNFSSNDYLGLANHPVLKQAAIAAVERFGAGSGASRLICGSLSPHHELEEALTAFKARPAALVFSTGYAAALGTICSVVGPEDIIVLDKLVHASIVDAARLSRAKLRVFRHNDPNDLEDLLRWASSQRTGSTSSHRARVLVVTESIFSMDGDRAPLREIVDLKEKYGAWLMVDEAHSTGLFGKNGRGLADELGISERIEIQMGTLGKALGAAGGFICGERALIDVLVNRARSFIFSTAPVPAATAAATAGIQLVQSEQGEKRRARLWQLVSKLPQIIGSDSKARSAIVPIIIGDESHAVTVAARLRDRGIFIPAIRYPTVARGKARLRLTLTAAHSESDLEELRLGLQAARIEPKPV